MKLRSLISEQTKYIIYCDMDGVLTDFSGDFIKLTKQLGEADVDERTDVPNNAAAKYEKAHGSEAFWDVVKGGGLKFWSDMTWNPGGKKLWKYISQYDPQILTAPSKRVYEDCVKGKKMWISRLGNPRMHVRSKDKKREFAGKNQILIDDLKSNISDWKASGGIGIHHKTTNTTISQLKDLGL
jgi:5'(3')-deoxyribonucleotidase